MQSRFGEMVREARNAKGQSGSDLGKVVGCTNVHLYGVESGGRAPSMELASRLTDALGLDPDAALRAFTTDRILNSEGSILFSERILAALGELMPAEGAEPIEAAKAAEVAI